MKTNHGFTLIECLVALFIIAIVLASATRAIGVSVDDVHNNYIREVGMWTADNQITQYYLDGTYPDIGISKKNVTMAGIDFIMATDISATGNAYFRKIEVTINEKNKPNYSIYRTVSFISQY